MGKYEPLARYLNSRSDNSWNATFAQIEEQLGFALPRSARAHRAWWSNQKNGNHSQTEGWRAAGWETSEVDLGQGIVRFQRRPAGTKRSASQSRARLLRQASELVRIDDEEALIDAALLALIEREAGRILIGLGGTMPDLRVPERERPA